ncbi:MAG: SAM-dependent methyltransferase [Bacteroidetes bacterium]|nr:SAM-dependent methyltransferase [Bacteroidota bacterium]
MISKLYLIPSSLGGVHVQDFLPEGTLTVIRSLQHFIVEDGKTARAFLKTCSITIPQSELVIQELDKHQPDQDMAELLLPMKSGISMGLLSEAGCPGVADPGARVVAEAHRNGYKVMPLVGPSSLLLALMASGLSGQQFCFHGYLPIDKAERMKKIQRMEEAAKSKKETQLFIETPYRNNQLLADLLQYLSGETKICLASDLTTPDEHIRTLKVKDWKKSPPELHKKPCVFLIG